MQPPGQANQLYLRPLDMVVLISTYLQKAQGLAPRQTIQAIQTILFYKRDGSFVGGSGKDNGGRHMQDQ